jgi:predicted RNase H-like HicB family nuclease
MSRGLPFPKPTTPEEIMANYEYIGKHLEEIGRKSFMEACRWAIDNGYDAQLLKAYENLKEAMEICEGVSQGVINPVKFRCLLALQDLKHAIQPLEEVLERIKEAKQNQGCLDA